MTANAEGSCLMIARTRKFTAFGALGALALAGCNDSEPHFAPYDVPNSVGIADFNGDGDPDLVVAATSVIYGAGDPGFLSVLLHGTTAPDSFVNTQKIAGGFNPSTLAVGDLDNDGNADVAVANAGSGDVSIFLQDAGSPGNFLPATFLPTGGVPLDVAVGDIDGDGADDLLIASFEAAGSVFVAYQDLLSPGEFGLPTRLPVGRPSTSVAIGDINGDGRLDLAATVQDADGSDGAVVILIQDPVVRRQFLAPGEFSVGTEPLSVRIADLDNDTRPDLVVVNEGPGLQGQGNAGVSVLLQDGLVAGSFLAPVSYASGTRPVHVAVGDLDGDGNPDLVVADQGGQRGAVSVLLQDPSRGGVFLTANRYPGFYGPLGVAIGDLNEDGLPDIAAADGSRATLLLQQIGSPGTFAAAVPVGD